MRGADIEQGTLFSVVTLESRVPADHPLRKIRPLLEETLDSLDRTFAAIYADGGRPSIPPERLIRASLLQVLYSIRSERQLMEQLDYNLLFRWFVGLTVDDPVWDHSTFSKNRERLIESGVARKIMKRLLKRARRERLLSSEHFSVDGTLLEAWAAVKGMRRRVLVFGYEVYRNTIDELLAEGETVHVITDREGHPRSLPDKYRDLFISGPKDTGIGVRG